jgi:polyhydroxyalkanoate synthesis regulator phasin
MQESSKSIQTPPEITDDPRMMRNYIKELEARVKQLEEEIKQVPGAMSGSKFFFKRPGRTEHEPLGKYLEDLEKRVQAIELRQEIGL